mgnify:CR=1 FL=1
MSPSTKKQTNSTPQNRTVEFPKNIELQKAIKDVSLVFRKYGLNYQQTKYVVKEARRKSNLRPPKDNKKSLPLIPSSDEIEKLLKISETNPTHWLILKLLVVSGLRISELINIKKENIFLDESKIFIEESKTGHRYVLFPESLRIHFIREIQKTGPGIEYLFTSRLHKPFSRKGVWWFIKEYAKKAKIDKNLHPHIFRHWWITQMAQVLSEKGLEVLSGNKDNLDRYIHLNVDQFKTIYCEKFK